MKFNTNAPAAAPTTPRAETQRKYNNCRANLLVVVLFTVINLFTLTFGNSYFLFSATFPALFPSVMSEIAADTEYLASLGMTPEDGTILIIVGLVIGLIMTVPYLLCWIFSKKRPGWMVAALVFFSMDCMLLLLTLDLSMIPDILIHAWVMFYLITGVKHGFKLKKMPEDEPLPAFGETVESETAETAESETAETAEGETASPAFDESLFEINEEKNDASKE